MNKLTIVPYVLLIVLVCSVLGEKDELIMVHAVWRHGWVTAPYDFQHGTQGALRQSTPKGLAQSFRMGVVMRKRYMEERTFLSPKEALSEVYIRSIDYNRSLTSAAAMLAGMFPTKSPDLEKVSGWPDGWMPIPIHTVPLEEDKDLNMGLDCPAFHEEWTKLASIPKYSKILNENKGIFEYVSRKTGMEVTRDNIGLLWASLAPTRVSKSEIPHWVNQTLLDRMQYLAKEELHYKIKSDAMIRLRGGPLANEIFTRMGRKWESMNNENSSSDLDWLNDLKYYGYSCRGMPILWQLAILGDRELTEDRIPRYSTCLLYELWNQSGLPHVSVYLYDGEMEEERVRPVAVRGCPEYPARCPLHIILNNVHPYLMDSHNWNKQCGLVETQTPRPNDYRFLCIIFGIIIIILTLLVIIQLCLFTRPKQKQGYSSMDEHALLISKSEISQ